MWFPFFLDSVPLQHGHSIVLSWFWFASLIKALLVWRSLMYVSCDSLVNKI